MIGGGMSRGILAVSVVTALIMILFGAFWMLTWLIGTNGYSEAKGLTILVGNAVLVLLSIIVAAVASGWLAKTLAARTAWSPWLTGPLAITAVTVVAVAALIIGSLLIIVFFGRTP